MNPRGKHRVRAFAVGGFLAVICGLPSAGRSTKAQEPPGFGTDCLQCHECPSPTPQASCLRPCNRPKGERITAETAGLRAPDVVILGELARLYLPVPFDHKGHATMGEMTGGCAVCHHYTPQGAEHLACKSCHSVTAGGGNIHKPGLKGAYHRQCLSCHREWSDETSCSICHQAKAGAARAAPLPSPDDLVGRMHPPIPEPETELYRTEREGFPATQVLFRHKAHIDDYDLRCSDCHREDNCNRCHAAGRNHVQRVRTLDEHHQPCFTCHKDDTCERCHFGEGQSPTRPFDHSDTGWRMKRYHLAAGCRDCHTAPPYASRDNACKTCHSGGFSAGRFDHAVTGLVLDETHRAFDCRNCHAGDNFAAPPVCGECHEPDEGIAYPARRPGVSVSDPAP